MWQIDRGVCDLEPPRQLPRLHLEVELDPPGRLADAIRLNRDAVSGDQERRAGGKVVCVLVPLHDAFLRFEEREERVLFGVGREPHRLEPDLLDWAIHDLGAERSGRATCRASPSSTPRATV